MKLSLTLFLSLLLPVLHAADAPKPNIIFSPLTPSPLHIQGQLDPAPSKAIS